MKKFIDSKTPLIIVILCFCILQVIFWPIAGPKIDTIETGTWVAYGFLNLPFIIAGALTFIRLKSQNNFVSTIPVFLVTVGYLFISLIANVIIMCVNKPDYVAPLVCNLLFLLIYAIVLIIAYKFLGRVEKNTEKREQRVRSHRNLGIEVSSLIGIIDDEEINKELSIIKEDIDYSSSASTPDTAEKDIEIRDLVSEIGGLLEVNADRETILAAIKKLKRALKVRNQILMASR